MLVSDDNDPEKYVKRNPEQRRFYHKIMDLVRYLEIPTKLAVVKNILKSIKNEILGEDKKDDN